MAAHVGAVVNVGSDRRPRQAGESQSNKDKANERPTNSKRTHQAIFCPLINGMPAMGSPRSSEMLESREGQSSPKTKIFALPRIASGI